MENREITMIGLLNRLYNHNAPKKISYNGEIYILNERINLYLSKKDNTLGYDYKLDLCLNDKVEILSEENDEWEDIEEIPKSKYDFTTLDLKKIVNKLIKNQNYLKEKLEDKDE